MGFLKLLESGKDFFFRNRVSKINDCGLDLSSRSFRSSKESNYLEDKIREFDRDLLRDSGTVPDLNLYNNLFKLAHKKLDNANGNLTGKVYEFMKEYVFNAEKLDYKNINDAIKYLRVLSSNANGEAEQAVETAVTVLSHLNDYLVRQSERGKESNSQGLKNYLFGERGVLTQKRLYDMKRVSDYLAKNNSKFKEKTNYKMAGKEGFDSLNVSYTRDQSGKIFANVNDDNSLGMYSGRGKLYWNVFDKMFDDFEGKIDTRAAVTKYVQRNISNLKNEGKVDYIKRMDWKKSDVRNYARFNY